MNPYAICIFLSAFLLFQIQPVISKTLLPWFGGTPAVWSTAMLFFEILLTGGYAYSNWLVRNRNPKKQTIIHLVLMGISVCLVIYLWIAWPSPITPAASWRPANISYPVLSVFLLLLISVGLPFFVLSTNSPLMQAWYGRRNPGRSPYWLYALSNIGSLLGLIAYPIVIEPRLTLQWQGWTWSAGYILFVILAGTNAVLTYRARPTPVVIVGEVEQVESQQPKVSRQGLWILLSAIPSLLVLAVTNQITQEVAPIPFLWVLPLMIYLLTFVLAFSSKRWYHRGVFTILLLLGTGTWIFNVIHPVTNLVFQIILYNFLLFAAAMICHGELYALRPAASHLTRFYLMVSIGGAIGGMIVNFVAPYIFRGYWEIYLGFAFVWILLAALAFQNRGSRRGFRISAAVGSIATAVTIFMIFVIISSLSGVSYVSRNFFGVTRVKQTVIKENQMQVNVLVHGSTVHGLEYVDPVLRDTPTAYFSADSGVGVAIVNNPHYGSGMRVGVLGLGIGTLAAYARPGDTYRFYEINPAIVDLANGKDGFFSFVKDSQAKVDIVLGDARVSLENELSAGEENRFDVLVLDTFSSDSIPMHLVTRQAFDIYLKNLADDGLIAAHISNNYLDLRPVFWQLAKYYDLDMAVLQNPAEKENPGAMASVWVLLTRNSKLLETPAIAKITTPLKGFRQDLRLWTDDYSNLVQILR